MEACRAGFLPLTEVGLPQHLWDERMTITVLLVEDHTKIGRASCRERVS
jgi:hypothetical protein